MGKRLEFVSKDRGLDSSMVLAVGAGLCSEILLYTKLKFSVVPERFGLRFSGLSKRFSGGFFGFMFFGRFSGGCGGCRLFGGYLWILRFGLRGFM